MLKKKKGQVSIEILIVLSILVIAAVFVGVYYIQSINKNKQRAGEIDDSLDSLLENIKDPFLDPLSPGDKLHMPESNPISGLSYDLDTVIKLLYPFEDPDVKIYYTIDESTPSPTNGKLFDISDPIILKRDLVIHARSYKDGFQPSNTRIFIFKLKSEPSLELSKLKSNPKPGPYRLDTPIELYYDDDLDVEIYYRLDNEDPTSNDFLFNKNNPIKLEDDLVISARAFREGYSPTPKQTFYYYVDLGFDYFFEQLYVINNNDFIDPVSMGDDFLISLAAETNLRGGVGVRNVRILDSLYLTPTDNCSLLRGGFETPCSNGLCDDLGNLNKKHNIEDNYYENFYFVCDEPGNYAFIFQGVLPLPNEDIVQFSEPLHITVEDPSDREKILEISIDNVFNDLINIDAPLLLTPDILSDHDVSEIYCKWDVIKKPTHNYGVDINDPISVFSSDSCITVIEDLDDIGIVDEEFYTISLIAELKSNSGRNSSDFKDVIFVSVNDRDNTFNDFITVDPLIQSVNNEFVFSYYAPEEKNTNLVITFNLLASKEGESDSCYFTGFSSKIKNDNDFILVGDNQRINYRVFNINTMCETPGEKLFDIVAYKNQGISPTTITTTYFVYEINPLIEVNVDFDVYSQSLEIGDDWETYVNEYEDDTSTTGGSSFSSNLLNEKVFNFSGTNQDSTSLYRGLNFYVDPEINITPSNYINNKICSLKLQTKNIIPTIIFSKVISCHSVSKIKVDFEDVFTHLDYELILTLKDVDRGKEYSSLKEISFIDPPLAFVNNPFEHEIYYKDNSFDMNLKIANPANLDLRITPSLYYRSNPGANFDASDLKDKLFFSHTLLDNAAYFGDPSMGGLTLLPFSTYNNGNYDWDCSWDGFFTNCNKTLNFTYTYNSNYLTRILHYHNVCAQSINDSDVHTCIGVSSLHPDIEPIIIGAPPKEAIISLEKIKLLDGVLYYDASAKLKVLRSGWHGGTSYDEVLNPYYCEWALVTYDENNNPRPPRKYSTNKCYDVRLAFTNPGKRKIIVDVYENTPALEPSVAEVNLVLSSRDFQTIPGDEQ